MVVHPANFLPERHRVFDRRLVRLHRDRAAPNLQAHDFLLREVAGRIGERLADVARSFQRALDLGCHDGVLGAILRRRGVAKLVQADLSPAMATAACRSTGAPTLVADEELLPFAPASFDLVVSNLSLHWVNDLPGCLAQIRRTLEPDGFFLAAMLGGATLGELRVALVEAETAGSGGANPRVSPFVELRDAAGLLQRAGFALPVADMDTVTVTYPDALRLMHDLRGMGESNALYGLRAGFTARDLMYRTATAYAERFGDADGRVSATFQLIYMAGWAPHAAQPKPLRPGSASRRLAEALDTVEHGAGDKARPHGSPTVLETNPGST